MPAAHVTPRPSRGGPTGPRLLVLADRVPRPGLRVADHRLLQLLAELTALEPTPVVTLLVADWCAGVTAEDLVAALDIEVVAHQPDWEAWLAGQRFDLLVVHGQVARQRFGGVLDGIFPDVPRLLDTTALPSLDLPTPLAPLRGDDEGRVVADEARRASDRSAVRAAAAVLCGSEHEASLVRELGPAAVPIVLRTHVDARPQRLPRSVRRDVALLGSFVDGPGAPDEDAALFLAEEVMPLVGAASEVVLHVVGEDATPIVRARDDGVRYHVARGPVAPWLDRFRAVIALRRYGRGATGALFAAAEACVPVIVGERVATWNDVPPALTVADDAAAFAAAIVGHAGDIAGAHEAAAALGPWAERLTHERYRDVVVDTLARLGVASRPGAVPVRIPWQGRGHGRRSFDPECRAAASVAPLVLSLADQVTTDGMDDPEAIPEVVIEARYHTWLWQRQPSPPKRWANEALAATLPYRPLVSVVVPVTDADPELLEATVRSVQAQVYGYWELCLGDDGSRQVPLLDVMARVAASDPRVSVRRTDEPKGAAAATKALLDRARGEFVAFARPGDELEPTALLEVVALLNRCPELDLVYTDAHERDPTTGRFRHALLKPSWSPDLLRSTNYIGDLTVIRRTAIDAARGIREEFEGAHEYDLILRVTDRSDRIGHVAKPLYRAFVPPDGAGDPFDRPASRAAAEAGRRALVDCLNRSGTRATVMDVDDRGRYRVQYSVVDDPLVSIIIPTRDRHDLLDGVIRSIHERSTYQNLEITIVDNASTDPATLEYLDRHDGAVLRYPAAFNYARMMNLALAEVRGDLALMLNNDIEVFQPDWVEAMIEHAQRSTVGAVGARLWYPSGVPQHQGVFIGTIGGAANHADFVQAVIASNDRHFLPTLGCSVANFAAVTGACLMARPSVLAEVGGFDERLHVAFNDADVCLKLRSRGYEVVCTPYASLVHHTSATRGHLHPMENDDRFRSRWRIDGAFRDSYCNPNYDQSRLFALRQPWR